MEGTHEPDVVEETMRTAILTIIGLFVVVFGWQRTTITELRATERRASAPRVEQPAIATSNLEHSTAENSGMSDSEFAAAIETLRELKSVVAAQKGKLKRGPVLENERGPLINKLPGILVRLSPEQLKSGLDVLTVGRAVTGEMIESEKALDLFIMFSEAFNPEGLIKVFQAQPWEKKDNAERHFATAFRAWLRKDAEGMLAWVRGTKVDPSLAEVSAVWTEAAETMLEPSPENVRKLLARPNGENDWMKPNTAARGEAVRGLRSQDARIQFFRSVHEVTGGTSAILKEFIAPLAEQLPFSQLAYIADSAPTIRPPEQKVEKGWEWKRQPGSLRFEAASASRDGTPLERWNWLTSRAEDVPSGYLLRDLVVAWCGNNHAETAAWVSTLPPGEQRDAATKAMAYFYGQNERPDLEALWKKR
jgi:hypothetical protein